MIAAQHLLMTEFGIATERARQTSRVIARTQVRFETHAVNNYIDSAQTGERHLEPVSADGGAAVDAAAAHQTGMAMASIWGHTALAAIHSWKRQGADPGTLPSAVNAQSPVVEQRVERHAVTQSLDAYNDEVRTAWKRLVREPDEEPEQGLPHGWREVTFRVWSAILDRKTCRRCFALDGEMVPVGKEFTEGANTPLHVLCRCIELAIVVPEAVRKKLPGVQIDYSALKADVKDYFRNEDLNTLGRMHIGQYLNDAVLGAKAKTSPETLLSKFHSRATRGYLAR